MKSILSAMVVIATSPMMSLPAQAHAYLVDSFPAAKQRLHAPLKTVKLRFSGRADAHYSTISLLREDGAVLATRTQPKAQREFDLPAPPLEPGRYRVHYRILSVDGDLVQGELDFLVEE
jgi:methionine-rich copper-binding protein CopC